MTTTLGTRSESAMAAPLEFQKANPLDKFGRELVRLHYHEDPIPFTQLRSASRKGAGEKVEDQHEARRREYEAELRQGAIAQARSLVERNPDSVGAHSRLLQVLLSVEESAAALDTAQALIQLARRSERSRPQDQFGLYLAAVVLSAAERSAEAESVLAKIEGHGPWARHYASLAADRGDFETALERLAGHDDILASSYRGYVLLALMRPQEALHELRSARRLGEDTPSLWANLAYAYASLGSPYRALKAAIRARTLAPSDRQMSFNLASYMRAIGDLDGALTELNRIASVHGEGDSAIASALAHACVTAGDSERGLRILRRAVHHHSFERNSSELAELRANLEFVRWRTGEISRDELTSSLWMRIRDAERPTVPLVRMLASFVSTDDLARLENVADDLRRFVAEEEMGGIEVRLHALRGDGAAAAELARAEAEKNPLDADAWTEAVYLRSYALGDFDGAGAMGREALRRIPGNRMLVNNTAYALAMAGRGQEAQEVLALVGETDDPFLTATQGLVALALNDVEGGLASYDRAAELIRRGPSLAERDALLQYLRANETLGLFALGLTRDVPADLTILRPQATWRSDTRFTLLQNIARKLEVDWRWVNTDESALEE